MDKCKECSNKFHYKEILKSIWLNGYAPIACNKCNTKHYVSVSTRIIIGLAIAGPFIIYNLLNLIFDEYIYFNNIIPYLIWIIVIVLLAPVYARYHIKYDEKQNDGTEALLATNLNNTESEIILSILNSYEIPYLKKSKGSDELMEIYFGANNYGIDNLKLMTKLIGNNLMEYQIIPKKV